MNCPDCRVGTLEQVANDSEDMAYCPKCGIILHDTILRLCEMQHGDSCLICPDKYEQRHCTKDAVRVT